MEQSVRKARKLLRLWVIWMKGFVRQSFRRQIFIIFLVVTLLLVVFGGILTVQGFEARLRADHEQQDEEREVLIRERILRMLELSEGTLRALSGSEMITSSLGGGPGNSVVIYAALYEASAPIRDFATVDLYSAGVRKYSTGLGDKTGYLPAEYAVLREAKMADGKVVYAMDPSNTKSDSSDLLIAQSLTDSDREGIAVVRISSEAIKAQLSGAINTNDGYMLTNRFFRPFCTIGTANDHEALTLIKKNLFSGKLYNHGAKNNIYISELADRGLLCVYITPPVLEEAAVRSGYRIIFMQVIISILVCLIAASRMSTFFSKPINALSSAMRRFRKGDFDARIDLNREDEFGQLATGFNKMTSQLKNTMDEQVRAERRENEARIEMMQAQLNPHFLYNTLDTIKWVAKANQVPEVATMSASLAAVLRMSISEDAFCPLSREIEMVRNYCEIQKIRFDDSFDLAVNTGECGNAFVPKLILQPLVENSIIHGLEGRKDGHIVIEAQKFFDEEKKKDILKITVTDNGEGIGDDMIKALENDDIAALSGHLGLKNINTIIRLNYGREYGVSAKLPEEGGTVMTVTLPYETSAEAHRG